jgi:hypothetical protein
MVFSLDSAFVLLRVNLISGLCSNSEIVGIHEEKSTCLGLDVEGAGPISDKETLLSNWRLDGDAHREVLRLRSGPPLPGFVERESREEADGGGPRLRSFHLP